MNAFIAIIMSCVLSVVPMTSCDVLSLKHAELQSTEESRFRDCPPWLEWMCGSEYYA